jgi:hypothetical protein
MSDEKLDRILLKSGFFDEESISRARAEAVMRQRKVPEILIDMGVVEEKMLAGLIARVGGVSLVDAFDREDVKRLSKRFPVHIARRHQVLPVGQDGDTLVVAAVDPFEPGLAQMLESTTGTKVRLVVGVRSQIEAGVLDVFGAEEEAEITLFAPGAATLQLEDGASAEPKAAAPEPRAEPEPVAEPEDEATNQTVAMMPPRSEQADDSTAPSVARGGSDSDRMAHIERQLFSISRVLALIQVRLDAIDARVTELGEATRLSR